MCQNELTVSLVELTKFGGGELSEFPLSSCGTVLSKECSACVLVMVVVVLVAAAADAKDEVVLEVVKDNTMGCALLNPFGCL